MGPRGTQEAAFIAAGSRYDFVLFAGMDRTLRLASVTVTRDFVPWDIVAAGLADYAADERHREAVVDLLSTIIPPLAFNQDYPKYFRLWEEKGIHLTPVHFYSPIPDTRMLSHDIWTNSSAMVGINMNDEVQLQLLEHFKRFESEYSRFPIEPTGRPQDFYFNNGQFWGADAIVLHCMVRHYAPDVVIEVGSGFSTRVSLHAAILNGNTKLMCIEPYPDDPVRHDVFKLDESISHVISLIPKRVQDIDLELFDQLKSGDILFIDTSHVSVIGGDVNYLLLEVIPRLNPGVVIHVHDIFFPREYPKHWVTDHLLFSNEQYLLQAFLEFNPAFEVLMSNSYLRHTYPDRWRATFPQTHWREGGSFWMRRKL
jgi:Methyltransferase domain